MQKIRLQKFISESGICSRRKAEEHIKLGHIKINGKVAILGDKVDIKKDKIMLNGKRVIHDEGLTYLMLHKPRGFVTTMNDEMGRKCVAQLISDVNNRVYPVGRLDKDSEGMLIFTNDGAFANAMMHPAHHVPKKYRVTVKPSITEQQITTMTVGMVVDGKRTAPADVHVIERGEGRVVLEMVLYEGRNREIRKMCEGLGLEVARLKRVAIGGVKLGMLQQGKWRMLTPAEVKKLSDMAMSKGIDEDD